MAGWWYGWPLLSASSQPVGMHWSWSRTRWKAELKFSDLFRCPEELTSFIPDFEYILWDALGFRDEKLSGNARLRGSLLTFQYIFRKDLKDKLVRVFEILEDISKTREGLEFIMVVLKYISNAVPEERLTIDELRDAVYQALPEKGDDIMPTIADTLREQGRRPLI